jgi:hypothetical protein
LRTAREGAAPDVRVGAALRSRSVSFTQAPRVKVSRRSEVEEMGDLLYG